MSYKTYDKYKYSGVKWVGEIPIDWNIIKAKHCFNISHGHYFKSEDFVTEGIDLVRIGDIIDGTIKLDNCAKLPLEYYSLFKDHIIKSNDLLIALTGATIGKVGHVPKTSKLMLMNYRVGKINCDNPNYYKYLLNSHFIQTQIKLISSGSAQENIGNKDFDELIILDIDDDTKKTIARYLDNQTSKIDETISKNEKLIQLLEEKRTALINQVVIKGLNPNVKLKDSGIEWIGEIPEHWQIRKFGNLIKLITKGATPTSYGFDFEDDGINFIKIESITPHGKFIKSKFNYITPECNNFLARSKMKDGDLLFSIAGALGRVAIVNEKILPANTNQALSIIRLDNNKLMTEYIFYALKTNYINYQINNNTVQSAQANLSMESIREFKILIPNLKEQKTMADYLDNETSKIDKTINKIKENIKLLEEYKTSLIHHVVTGKIDVRGEVL